MTRFVLVAGEASGDLLGGELIHALREWYPNAHFAGIGGERMAAAGMHCWYSTDQLAVMGLAEVLLHLKRLIRLRNDVRKRSLAWQPHCFIGIDAPDFNFGLERRLKQAGIPTTHYVSPSIWAWRQTRARKIARSTDLLLTLFPFEPALYARHGVIAKFVGHPLADRLPLVPDTQTARASLGLPQDATVIALLPGSRSGEIARLGPIFVQATKRLLDERPDLIFISPQANHANLEQFRQQCGDLPVTIIRGQSLTAMTAADLVLLASGTAALEAMLCKKPMVVGYRVAALTHWIVRAFRLLKVKYVSLPNVLAQRALVPELLQSAFDSETLAKESMKLLKNLSIDDAVAAFEAIHNNLRCDASRSAAKAIHNMLTANQ